MTDVKVAGAYDDVHEYVIHPLPQHPGSTGEHLAVRHDSPEDSETPESGAGSVGTGRVLVAWKKIGFQSFSDDGWVNASVHIPLRNKRRAEQSQSLETDSISEDYDEDNVSAKTTSDEMTWKGEQEQEGILVISYLFFACANTVKVFTSQRAP